MVSKQRFFALTACVLLASPTLVAQEAAPRDISFSGYSGATQEELLAVSGLHKGAPLSQPDVQAAAQKLNDTGMFNSVRFQVDGQGLHFALEPSPNVVLASYQNFPWWTQQELKKALEARVPLFHGEVPLAGGLLDQVTASLTAIVATKGVKASILSTPDESSGKGVEILFRIASPGVQVGTLTFTGVSADWSGTIAKFSSKATGQGFTGDAPTKDTTATDLNKSVGNLYRERGFLEAAIAVTQQPATFDGSQVLVPETIAVTEGRQYRVRSLTLTGAALASQEDFLKFAKLKSGDVADQVKLRESLALLSDLYQNAGYLGANVAVAQSLNPARQTVDYTVRVVPGDLYHMGDLQLDNLTAEQQTAVLRVWEIKKGDVYRPAYVRLFLKNHAGELHSLDGYSASFEQTPHADTHLVDLTAIFHKGGPLN